MCFGIPINGIYRTSRPYRADDNKEGDILRGIKKAFYFQELAFLPDNVIRQTINMVRKLNVPPKVRNVN